MRIFKILLCLIYFPYISGFTQTPKVYVSSPTFISSLPVVNAGGDLYLPPGQTSVQPVVTSDDPGPGVTYAYSWNGPGFSSSLMQPALSTLGTYNLQATNQYGCSSSDQLVLRTVSPTDSVWTVFPLPPLCQGQDSLILDEYISYLGKGSFSGTGVIGRCFYPDVAGTYNISWLIGTKTVSVSITVHPKPDVRVYLDTVLNCKGKTALLGAIGTADNYAWSYLSSPNTVLSTLQNYSVTIDTSTHYLLTAGIVYSDKTCFVKDTIVAVPITANFNTVQEITQGQFGLGYSSLVSFVPDFKVAQSYNWNFGDYNGGPNASAEVSPLHNYTHYSSGSGFTVTLTMSSMCGLMTASKQVIVNMLVTNVSELELVDVALYPNPATTSITVVGLEKAAKLEIFDLSGRVVLAQPLNGQLSTDIEVSSYMPGVYLLKIAGQSGGVKITKFVKQ